MSRKGESQIAKGLKGLLPRRIADHLLAKKLGGIFLFPVENELADFRKLIAGAIAHIIMRLAGPQRVLVELDSLLGASTENHRAESPASDGQSLLPLGRGLLIPEHHVACARHAWKQAKDRQR